MAVLTVWKLSQYLCESCNFGCPGCVVCNPDYVTVLNCAHSRVSLDTTGFDQGFSTHRDTICAWILSSWFCVQHCNCSHLPNCYFSASIPSLKCARAWGMSSMSSCLFVAHHFLSCAGILGLFEVSFSTVKMALAIKVIFLCPALKSDHTEAQKNLFSGHLDAS